MKRFGFALMVVAATFVCASASSVRAPKNDNWAHDAEILVFGTVVSVVPIGDAPAEYESYLAQHESRVVHDWLWPHSEATIRVGAILQNRSNKTIAVRDSISPRFMSVAWGHSPTHSGRGEGQDVEDLVRHVKVGQTGVFILSIRDGIWWLDSDVIDLQYAKEALSTPAPSRAKKWDK